MQKPMHSVLTSLSKAYRELSKALSQCYLMMPYMSTGHIMAAFKKHLKMSVIISDERFSSPDRTLSMGFAMRAHKKGIPEGLA